MSFADFTSGFEPADLSKGSARQRWAFCFSGLLEFALVVFPQAESCSTRPNDVRSALRIFCGGKSGGAEGNRTPDLYNAIVALSQLSYSPILLAVVRLMYFANAVILVTVFTGSAWVAPVLRAAM